MAGNRKAFEKIVLGFMGEITNGQRNKKIYESLFKRLNDDQFEQFVQSLENGGCLSIWMSNWDKKEDLNFDLAVELCKKYGVALETQLVIFDEDSGLEIVTPETYIVGTAEARKQRQMLVKKFGAAKDDIRTDDLTGQVIGDSRGAGISNPELQVLLTLGLPTVAMELADVRGGDQGALNVYRTELIETGTTNVKNALKRGSGVKSLSTAHFLLRGRHISNNLDER